MGNIMNEEFQFFLPITKIDKERRTVSGYATTETKDLDGEIISLDAVRKALPGYMQWRNIREMHLASAVGVAKEANVDQKGLFLTAKIVDDNAWNKCLENVYNGFSIGARKLAKVGDTITDLELVEISVVDRPCNSDCRFEVQKRASPDAAAYLTLLRTPRNRRDVALEKMAEVVQTLTREDDEEEVSVNEVLKRDFSAKERESAASSGAALPDGSFPIENASDLANARQAVGRAKDKPKARAHIKARARELGVALPKSWSKKIAKSLIAEAEKTLATAPEPPVPQDSSFSPAIEKVSPPTDLGTGGTNPSFDPILDDAFFKSISKRVKQMSELNLTKAAGAGNVFKSARDNLKKSKISMNEAKDCIKAAHAIVKAAILAKAAKPNDDDADDQTMKVLQKAFAAIEAAKTFNKAANGQLKKAAGGPTDSAPEYTVPAGVKEVSPEASSGMFQLDQDPGANGTVKMVSQTEADALARAAAAEAKVSVLEKLPNGNRRPMPFEMPIGTPHTGADLSSMDPEEAYKVAGAAHIGSILTKGGKSVFDPNFKGGAV
jgi:phage head maturation protease